MKTTVAQELLSSLTSILEKDPLMVRNELHLFREHCQHQGITHNPTLAPYLLTEEQWKSLQQFGALYAEESSKILSILTSQHHKRKGDLREILQIEGDEYLETIADAKYGEFPRVMRPDFVVVNGGQLLAHEVNVSWPGGAPDADILRGGLSRNYLFTRLADELSAKNISCTLPTVNQNLKLLLDQLLEASGKSDPYIVIVQPPPTEPGFSDYFPKTAFMRDFFRSKGMCVNTAQPWMIEYDGHKVSFDGTTVDVVYRIFEEKHIKGDDGSQGYRRIVQAELDRNLALVNSSRSDLIGSKAMFEILWEDRFEEIFDSTHLSLLRKYIPLTKNVKDLSASELDYINDNKEEFVQKGVRGSSGSNVVIGLQANDEQWIALLEENRESGEFVVQQYTGTPTMMVPRIDDEQVILEPRRFDLGPLYFCGKKVTMGSIFGRYSLNLMTAHVSDYGGVYPVIQCSRKE